MRQALYCLLGSVAAAAGAPRVPSLQARALSADDSGEEAGTVACRRVQRGGGAESTQVTV